MVGEDSFDEYNRFICRKRGEKEKEVKKVPLKSNFARIID